MGEGLNLTLPDRGKRSEKRSKAVVLLLSLVLIVAAANLVVVTMLFGISKGKAGTVGKDMPAEAVRGLALKLEEQGLREHAADAWKEYLAAADAGNEERAKVWYRLGKLYQDGNSYEQALDAYYRSESYAKLPDIEQEINSRVQECLEAAGKFAALRYELAGRVGLAESTDTAGGEVLAEIGDHKITKAELDRRIDEMVDRQLQMMGAYMPEQERVRQKDEMVKQFASGQERTHILDQMLFEELLYRKAREEKLADAPEVKALLQDAERGLLAQRALQKEISEQVKITPGDLQTWYDAHKKDYVEPEQAKISHILVKDESTAKEIIAKLKDGGNFEELAKERSLDEETKTKGGAIDTWVQKGGYVPSIGSSDEVARTILGADAGKVIEEPVASDNGFHVVKVTEKKPERQKTLDEARDDIYQALRSQKETEVREALMNQLKEQYKVVVHTSRLDMGTDTHAAPRGDDSK